MDILVKREIAKRMLSLSLSGIYPSITLRKRARSLGLVMQPGPNHTKQLLKMFKNY